MDFFTVQNKKKRILEYSHRSDEQLMVEGLAMLLMDAPRMPMPHAGGGLPGLWRLPEDIATVMAP